jgi:hypothetical protein
MLEDDVEQHAHSTFVRSPHQFHEVGSVAQMGIDVEEILDGVAVVVVVVPALLENGTQPQRGHAETLQVVELGNHAAQVSPLPAVLPRVGPRRPIPAVAARGSNSPAIEQRPLVLGAVAEAIDDEKIEDLVLPIDGRGKVIGSARERYRAHAIRSRSLQHFHSERCHAHHAGRAPS